MVTKVRCNLCNASILSETVERTGGSCMRCFRLGPPTPSEIVQRARRTPARCIAQFHPTLEMPDAHSLWELVESACFRLACACGASSFHLSGTIQAGSSELGGRLDLACVECVASAVVFDPERHGYNAEVDPEGSTDHQEQRAYLCPACHLGAFEIDVTLMYQIDEDIDQDIDDGSELGRRPQDFFTTFALGARCVGCGGRTEAASYECA